MTSRFIRNYPHLEIEVDSDKQNTAVVSIVKGKRLIADRPFDYATGSWTDFGYKYKPKEAIPMDDKGWDDLIVEHHLESQNRAILTEDISFAYDDLSQEYNEFYVKEVYDFALVWADENLGAFHPFPQTPERHLSLQRMLSIAAVCDVFDGFIADNPTADFIAIDRSNFEDACLVMATHYSEGLETAHWQMYSLINDALPTTIQFGEIEGLFTIRYLAADKRFHQMNLIRIRPGSEWEEKLAVNTGEPFYDALDYVLEHLEELTPYPYLIDEAKAALTKLYDLQPVEFTYTNCMAKDDFIAAGISPASDAKIAASSAVAQVKKTEYAQIRI